MKKRHGLLKFYIFVIIIALLIIFVPSNYKRMKTKATVEVIDKVFTEKVKIVAPNGEEVKIDEMYEKLDESEQEKVDEIVNEYVTPDTIKEVTEIMKDGVNESSQKEIAEYAKENIDVEDAQYIYELYKKYYENNPEELQKLIEENQDLLN